MLSGTDFFGIVVTNYCFQILGHTLLTVITLYMLHSRRARKLQYLEMRAGKMSSRTINFGFLKALSQPAT